MYQYSAGSFTGFAHVDKHIWSPIIHISKAGDVPYAVKYIAWIR